MDIVGAIKEFFSAVAGYFGWAKQRDAEKNAQDVKDRAKAQAEVDAKNRMEKAVANKDTNATRNELAE